MQVDGLFFFRVANVSFSLGWNVGTTIFDNSKCIKSRFMLIEQELMTQNVAFHCSD